tara:strand:- start:2949 stop:3146 length:198 start_codon:yes stop_codon:yes gene_type:complete
MRVKQRDVVLIKYPFSDLKKRKVRPAVVISNNVLNGKSEDCIAVKIGILNEESFKRVKSEFSDLM